MRFSPGNYLSCALFLPGQSVKQVILPPNPCNSPLRALFLPRQSVKQVIITDRSTKSWGHCVTSGRRWELHRGRRRRAAEHRWERRRELHRGRLWNAVGDARRHAAEPRMAPRRHPAQLTTIANNLTIIVKKLLTKIKYGRIIQSSGTRDPTHNNLKKWSKYIWKRM